MGKTMTDKLRIKSSNDFADPSEWRDYVRAFVPAEEVDYVLAFERTQLFLCFYKLRGMKPPAEVKAELDRIAKLNDPERTEALEAFNDWLLATTTMRLMLGNESPNVDANHFDTPTDPRTQIDILLDHLGRTSPCFVFWRHYRKDADTASRPSWEKFIATLHRNELSKNTNSDREYALLIGQLGQLLTHYRDGSLRLPPFLFERIWFLDRLRGPERTLQARAVVQGLIEAMKPCASA
jgi:hypothetical protein